MQPRMFLSVFGSDSTGYVNDVVIVNHKSLGLVYFENINLTSRHFDMVQNCYYSSYDIIV